jgi:hypothetical protein
VVGLGRAVGAGADMVIFGVVGLGAGAAELVVCIHLSAILDAAEPLSATLDAQETLAARLDAQVAMTAVLDPSITLSGVLDSVETLSGSVGEEC